MNLLESFKQYLKKPGINASEITIRNYLADVRSFIRWYQSRYGEFIPTSVLPQYINQYKQESGLSLRSFDRHCSSLRKFYAYLIYAGICQQSPFETEKLSAPEDIWKLKEFKDLLYTDKASYLTVKNYVNDLLAFKKWCLETLSDTHQESETLSKISPSVVEEYKKRLVQIVDLSPNTVNRKLSSIRRYLSFAQSVGLVKTMEEPVENVGKEANIAENPTLYLQQQFAPSQEAESNGIKGISQKLFSPYEKLEDTVARSVVSVLNHTKNATEKKQTTVSNISKEFYAPHQISLTHFTWYQKLLFHVRHTRPIWYKRYHNYSFVHYVHVAILIIVCVTLAVSLYFSLLGHPSNPAPVLAAGISPPKVILFRGKLVPTHTSTTSGLDLRFAIYNSPTATGSALLWQETQDSIKTDSNGVFSVILGSTTPIPASLIQNQSALFVGISVGQDSELTPRQRITGTAYADNADLLSGLPVMTTTDKDTNVVLALDSTGNLTIGGTTDHTFQTTGGSLKLLGQTLELSTNDSSNGDIVLNPDGTGQIDIQHPIKNSGTIGNLTATAGAVEFDDSVSILATESAHAAFTIEQDGFGSLIAASTSGTPKFTVDYNGGITNGTWQADQIGLRYGGTGSDLSAAIPGSLTYVASQSAMAAIKPGNIGDILVSQGTGASPQWVSPNNLSTLPWIDTGNVLSPSSSTVDFTLGGTSTGSAKFGVLNMGSGTPNMFLKDSSNQNGLAFTADGTIQSLNNGTLTLGGTSTGSIIFKPAGNASILALTSAGTVGIGTVTPLFKLDVEDNQAATVAASIYNGNSGTDADGLLIKLGNTDPNTVATTNHFISFETAGIGVVGAIEGNGGQNISYMTHGVADFAEYMAKDPNITIPYGSLLCLDNSGKVVACTSSTDALIGVASPHPTFVGGENNGDASIAVGMMGQIQVRVSTVNGPIQPRDPIMASVLPGVGVKATTPGKIIGRAVEGYAGAIGTEGNIMVAVEPTWYDPSVALTDAGELRITTDTSLQLPNPNTQTASLFQPIYSVVSAGGQTIQNIGAFSYAFIGSLKAGAVEAEQITTKSLAVTTDSLTVGGTSFRDYIAGIIHDMNRGTASADSESTLSANMISPLTGNDLTVNLGDATTSAKLAVTAGGKQVASIDTSGNATFSGTLAASGAQITGTLSSQDASISGTLHAGTIVADNIDGLDQKIQALATQSASQTINPQTLASASIPNFSNAQSATMSSILADFATLRDGLVSLGPTSFADTSVASTLSIGGSMTFSNNAINTLGSDLEINPLGQGAISFLAGKVRIETDGTVNFAGDAHFAGNVSVQGALATNILSPLGDSNLNVNLDSQTNLHQSLAVNNAHGNVFSIDQSGNVVSSGSATFAGDLVSSGSALLKKLNIFSSPVYAVSDTESIATGSAGVATIKVHHTETTIQSTLVTDHSLIYITPIGDTNNQVVSLLRQVPGQSFTVGVEDPTIYDVKFNWIIIN